MFTYLQKIFTVHFISSTTSERKKWKREWGRDGDNKIKENKIQKIHIIPTGAVDKFFIFEQNRYNKCKTNEKMHLTCSKIYTQNALFKK